MTPIVAAVIVLFAGRLYRNAVLRTGARLHVSEAWHREPARQQAARA